MATREDFMRYVLEQVGLFGRLSYRRMFGEYAIYLDGKVVALLCDNSFFVKQTPAQGDWNKLPQGHPFPGAKAYWVADEWLDAPERLAPLLEATALHVKPPKPRKPRKSRKSPQTRDQDR